MSERTETALYNVAVWLLILGALAGLFIQFTNELPEVTR